MKNFKDIKNFETKYLFEAFNILEISTLETMNDGMLWMVENNIDGVLIGGTAVVSYLDGSRELTPDIDFMVRDINRVKEKLNDDDVFYENLVDYNGGYIGINLPQYNIDLLDANEGNTDLNKLIFNTKNSITVGGYNVNVASPEMLAIMKLNLGREKDLNDGIKILQSGKVDGNKFSEYVERLSGSLEDYESIKSYVDLII